MMPAMMPARSWSAPRVAETLDTSETSKASGRAPYFKTLASWVADCWVKLPEISARPPGNGLARPDGAEMTSPSRTMANRFWGGCFAGDGRSSPLRRPGLPSALNSRLTTHCTWFCGTPAEAW